MKIKIFVNVKDENKLDKFWQILIILTILNNFWQCWQWWTLSTIFDFWQFWHIWPMLKILDRFDIVENVRWLWKKIKQARKSSEDTQVTGYARFEKSLGLVSFGSKRFGPKIFLLIFSLNWIILGNKIFIFFFGGGANPLPRLISGYPAKKWKKKWGLLSSTSSLGWPETLSKWKSESVTDGRPDGRTSDMGRC